MFFCYIDFMFRRFLMICCVCSAGLFSASAGDWYSVEMLTDLAIVPIFAVNPEVYTADTSALSHEILLEYLKLKNYPTPKAAAASRKPCWMRTLLISDEISPLSSKKHLAAVARQHGDKFAAIYKAYIRSVEKESAPVGDSGLDDADLFRLITLVVSRTAMSRTAARRIILFFFIFCFLLSWIISIPCPSSQGKIFSGHTPMGF